MEELVEGPLKFIARIILTIVRIIIWFSWEVMCERFLWYLGWPVVKVVTLGNLPREGFNKMDRATPLVHFLVALVGLCYPLALAYILSGYLG